MCVDDLLDPEGVLLTRVRELIGPDVRLVTTYDLHGNLHEWIADPAGTFKGGFYVDAVINGSGCAYTTTAHTFDYHDYSTGFRCCADPE
mgnify:CR=1 FL=1